MSTSEHTNEPTVEKGSGVEDDDIQVPKLGYRHPAFQVVLVSFVCFACPGMFNALAGLGGGGQIDATTQDNAAVTLYSAFAGMAFFGGSIVNKIGPRLAIFIGSTGYVLYIGSFLSYNINGNHGFVIGAGAILGLCAGILWTAQGVLMLAYSTEATKGRYIAMFWMIFNIGAVIGSAVPLALTFHQTEDVSVGNGTYIAFIILTASGMCATLLLSPPSTVRRADGTRSVVMVQLSWIDEIRGVFQGLLSDPLIILLLPYFWASNWFYTWQFNDFNLALFNPRTRALNNLLYWLSQILGAGLFGLFLDSSRLSRRSRAHIGWVVLLAQIMAVWAGNLVIQRTYDRDNKPPKMDLTDKLYAGRAILYIWNGISDACWQTYAYWMIGAVSNNSRKLSVLVGIYKGVQSAAAAVGWRLDAQGTSYVHMFASTWGLLVGGLVFALPMIILRVENHTWAEDDVLGGIDAAGNRVDDHSRPHSVAENFSAHGHHRLEDTYHRRNYPMEELQAQHHYPLQRSKER
ncbi:major facilitator superfamily transporter [Exidia glandulosa HHB12029]|uniref:Major facilitator superfamily transporter n=1 Tax=Exidia glandulosa HHB12029 TaxID=1314781 RepID=A0A165ZPQ1_EXIGL|nr:major facilitator superfamily transporter [Exidia glandulosa HHB12029]